jgi:hypothetical protein
VYVTPHQVIITMGLGILRKNKTALWSPATTYDYGCIGKTQHVARIIDCNAKIRRTFFGDASPRDQTKSYINNHILNIPGILTHVVVACDSGKLIPDIRIQFHKKIRYAKSKTPPTKKQVCVDGINYAIGTEPIDDADVSAIHKDGIPNTWPRVWAHHKGKQEAMDVIVECFKEELPRLTENHTACVIDPPNEMEGVWKCNAGNVDPEYADCGRVSKVDERTHRFGEADSKVAEEVMRYATKHPGTIVIVDTIDWDMTISALCLKFPSNVYLQMSMVYANDEGRIEYSSGVGKTIPRMERKPELLSPHRLYQTHNPYNTAFWVLCMNGCDYCTGTAAFGFKESAVIDIACASSSTPFITKSVTNGARTLSLDVELMLQSLREITRVHVPRPAVLTARVTAMTKRGPNTIEHYSIDDAIADFLLLTDVPVDLTGDYIGLFSSYGLTKDLQKLKPQGVQAIIDNRRERVVEYQKKNTTYHSVEEFEFELNRIWTCIIYFHGFDPQRCRGGPISQQEQWFKNCEDVDDVMEQSHDTVITYIEEYPDATPRY